MVTGSVVLYHTAPEDVKNVIDSFCPDEGRELYLIDNSEQGTTEYLNIPFVSYIFNGKNLGYGAGHNIGLHAALEKGADFHVILNPDISFEPDLLPELETYALEHPDVVYILPKVCYPNGEIQYLCKLLPTPADLFFRRFIPIKKVNDRYCLKDSGYDKIMDPPCLSGCFMFLRMSVIKENDLFFDDRFFMYFEDFDLIRRLHRVGKTIFYPYRSIIHRHEKASYKNLHMLKVHLRSGIQYFHKYGWFIDKERKEMNRKILSEIEQLKEVDTNEQA